MKKYLLGLLLFLGIGFINFGNCFDLPGFTEIYSHHFSDCNIDYLAQGTAGNICDGNTKYLYKPTDLGIYCVSLENISLSNYSITQTSNVLSFGLGIVANNSTPNNSFLRLSQSTFSQYSNGTLSSDVILCGSNFINGYSADFIVTFTNTLSSLFSNNSLSFDLKMYYLPYNYSVSSLCSSYVGACESELTACQSELTDCQSDNASLSNALGNCGSSLNSCQTALGNCMQGNYGTGQNWSALFINGIQHLGKPIINVVIPDEIAWDYTGTDSSFDLTVEGYNVDSDYIQSVIDVQNYIPTTEDFTEVFSNFKGFGGLIVVCLFVILVFYMIKKIF